MAACCQQKLLRGDASESTVLRLSQTPKRQLLCLHTAAWLKQGTAKLRPASKLPAMLMYILLYMRSPSPHLATMKMNLASKE